MLVKSTNVSLIVKMNGDKPSAQNTVLLIVIVHSSSSNVQVPGIVKILPVLPLMSMLNSIPTKMDKSISVIKSNLNTMKLSLKTVTKIMTEPLISVKSTLVSLCVKTNGEMKTVQDSVMLIVTVHSLMSNVMPLGLVTMLLPSP